MQQLAGAQGIGGGDQLLGLPDHVIQRVIVRRRLLHGGNRGGGPAFPLFGRGGTDPGLGPEDCGCFLTYRCVLGSGGGVDHENFRRQTPGEHVGRTVGTQVAHRSTRFGAQGAPQPVQCSNSDITGESGHHLLPPLGSLGGYRPFQDLGQTG